MKTFEEELEQILLDCYTQDYTKGVEETVFSAMRLYKYKGADEKWPLKEKLVYLCQQVEIETRFAVEKRYEQRDIKRKLQKELQEAQTNFSKDGNTENFEKLKYSQDALRDHELGKLDFDAHFLKKVVDRNEENKKYYQNLGEYLENIQNT